MYKGHLCIDSVNYGQPMHRGQPHDSRMTRRPPDCVNYGQVLVAPRHFGDMVARRTVVYYGRAGDQRAAL
jgi:hypothetical protein